MSNKQHTSDTADRPGQGKSASFLQRMRKKLPIIGQKAPQVAVLELTGAIGVNGIGGSGLSHAKIAPLIKIAFETKNLTAVALRINSPGGSPVQSRMICDAIRDEAAEKGTPVFSFIEDVGASGGYILALAGDEIYADQSSIVGSIGVISAGFGFDKAIARIGIDRRIRTAGISKSRLDPFEPEKTEDLERLQVVLNELHDHFKNLVKERRGDRLGNQEDIFTGDFWTAAPAQERGLIDGTERLAAFMKTRFGEEVKFTTVKARQTMFKKLFGSAHRPEIRHSAPDQPSSRSDSRELNIRSLLDVIDERSLWARFGL